MHLLLLQDRRRANVPAGCPGGTFWLDDVVDPAARSLAYIALCALSAAGLAALLDA
ncbi:MAG TPA: hypothetical protein VEB20_09945 [Azospirillaceae bacterium]|nr:hypothetical protein [Azospirillaceae bacterium]